tara:strand:+ start:5173 stop:6858 length:1686 start_codon:yes stop_codon:yes gene_type:complete
MFSFGQRNPDSLIEHRVKKKETLFSISKKYKVSIEDIELYNPIISKIGLKKKMLIKIPVFVQIEDVDENIIIGSLIDYKIPPKDTKWRIAYKYGITIDSLESLNPEIKIGLKSGQIIKVPNVDAEIKNIQIEYSYYKVKPKEDFYGIEKKTGVSENELIKLNPDLATNGLKAAMILKIAPLNFKKLKLDGNLLIERISLKDSINENLKIKLGVMLPFKVNELELDSLLKTKDILTKRNLHTISLGFYSGVIMAAKKATNYNLTIYLEFIDTQNDIKQIDKVLFQKKLSKVDALLGPLISSNFDHIIQSDYLKNIPMVAPLSSNPVKKAPNVYQSVSSQRFLRDKMMMYLERKIDTTNNVIIIADSINRSIEQELKCKFPYAHIVRPEKGGYMSTELVDSLLIDSLPNKIIFESQNLSLISNITSLLNSQVSSQRNIQLFTTYRSNYYENNNISRKHLGNIKFSYTSGYIAREDEDVNLFENEFLKEFSNLPSKESKRAYDLTLDVILRLAYAGRLEDSLIGETEYLENRFDYVSDPEGGYKNQGYYLLEHDGYSIKEINKQ